MLGSIYERSEHNEIAGQFYTRIVKDYPLSSLASGAKDKLVKFGVPVPQPDPAAMARMQKEQQALRPRGNLLARPVEALVKTGPDVRMAARAGAPTLTPEDSDNTETLTPGGSLTVGASVGPGAAGGSTGAFVETVTPGSSTSIAPSTATGATTSGTPGPAAADTTSGTAAPAGDAASTVDATTSATGSDAASQSSDPKNESSSKKKKGVRKVLPF